MARLAAAALLAWSLWIAGPVAAGVADTVHNLSVSGPGSVKEPGVTEVCVFCHTPHSANPQRGLWNRELSGITYTLYESSTTEATIGQPTGASRLCLSCHDGTLALGDLWVGPYTGPASLGPLTGPSALGTSLSDHHPVSFFYDLNLSLQDGQLADPATLPSTAPLDDTGQMQCTSCHDAHDDPYRAFLRVDDRGAELCASCHQIDGWAGSTHATSPATWPGTGTDPWPSTPYTTVADNGCENCHRPHAAPRPPRLLSTPEERAVCLVCHDGNVTSKNLEPEFLKASVHPIETSNWLHEPREDPNAMLRHVTCADCHDPHEADSTLASAPAVPGRLRGVPGIDLAGAPVGEAVYEYEVCLKCHGVQDQATSMPLVRDDNTRNVRLEISPNNPSYHPVAEIGQNQTMGGFEPGYSTASIIYCTGCHNNDDWTPAGTAPAGGHGSRHRPILEREYQMADPTPETSASYALCYKCHDRDHLINDTAGTFLHRKHVVEENTSCAVCHDAHGSRQSRGLINFMRLDSLGSDVVTPSGSGQLEFNSLIPGQGECYLTCHGVDHDPEQYPD